MSVKPGTVVAVIVVVVSLSLAGIALYSPNADKSRLSSLENELQTLRERVTRLSYNTASGGGVNLKMMPDPVTGQPTVPLEEVFSFDRNHAMCRVDANRQAFKLPTYQLGEVVVEPNSFFMSMVATSIEQYRLETQPNGTRKVTMRVAAWTICNLRIATAAMLAKRATRFPSNKASVSRHLNVLITDRY